MVSAMIMAPIAVAAAKVDGRDSMVKVFAVLNRPDYTNPWNMFGSISMRCSGCVIKGKCVLTNAHVVSD